MDHLEGEKEIGVNGAGDDGGTGSDKCRQWLCGVVTNVSVVSVYIHCDVVGGTARQKVKGGSQAQVRMHRICLQVHTGYTFGIRSKS